MLAAELDEPVPQEKHGDLARAFKEKHKFRPPSNWLLTERTLGRFWRALTSRRMENLDIQIMATADEISVIISSPVKAKIGPFEVTHHARGKTKPEKQRMAIHTPLQWLHGMKLWCYTLATAGCFQIERRND